ncbi:ATP-binding protein [Candidatus Micrarchaeota archaeon]|nr:ATP-binding protein [Candidatus Micrarchaeota archaeon]
MRKNKKSARNKKYYPIDLGLRKSIISQAGQDFGKDLETVVFYHLRKKYRNVFYWRDTGEVDFVIQDKESIVPYQVSWDEPKERHFEALKEFKEHFPHSKAPIMISRKNVIEFLKT